MRDKLIAKQALEIEELKEKLQDFEDKEEEIHTILYAIGAPLNDNLLQYSKKQLGPFWRIADIINN